MIAGSSSPLVTSLPQELIRGVHRSGGRSLCRARPVTSGEYRLKVCFVIAPPSQAVEPPANPERFTQLRAFGFVTWGRRLVRAAWRAEQTSSAYTLADPAAALGK
jgi:hypothetical protein